MNYIKLSIQSSFWFNKENLAILKEKLKKTYGDFNELTLIDERITLLDRIRELSPYIEEEIIQNNITSYFKDLYQWKELLKNTLKIKNRTISAVILTLDEERCIKRCVDSIIEKVDEVIVVDTGSTDRTIDILKEYQSEKISIFHYDWKENFAEARNFGIEKAKSSWIFHIDADEYLNNIDTRLFRNIINLFNDFPLKDSIVLSPSITNHNEHNLLIVKRIFLKESNIRYFGLIHEEPRRDIKNYGGDVYNISLDIDIRHDGYSKEILAQKNKTIRNVSLLKKMVEIEPNNPRWKYFLIRDDSFSTLNSADIEYMIKDSILLDKEKNIEFNNLCFHEFTFALLDLLTELKLSEGKFDEVCNLANILERLLPENSNSFYYKILSKILKSKEEMYELLNKTIEYRDNSFSVQHGMLHSNGYHIDFLISVLLFEIGMYKQSFKYFDFLKDKFIDDNIYFSHDSLLSVLDERK